MRRTLVLMLAILFQGCVGMLFAQEKYGYEFGVYSGKDFWKDQTFQSPLSKGSLLLSSDHYDDKWLVGIRLNILSRKYWAGEFSYSLERNNITLSRQSFLPINLDSNVQRFFYDTVFYPLKYETGRVIPFAAGGIGVAAYQLDFNNRIQAADPLLHGIPNLESIDKRFAFDYGAGVKAEVYHHVGIRADFRHIFSDVPSYGLPKEPRLPPQVVAPFQGKLQTFQWTAGVYYYSSSK
jgi:opacity protein-like surface antigen